LYFCKRKMLSHVMSHCGDSIVHESCPDLTSGKTYPSLDPEVNPFPTILKDIILVAILAY
jgi:hypothetical protein